MNDVLTFGLIALGAFVGLWVGRELARLVRALAEQARAHLTQAQQQTLELLARQVVDAANRERLIAIAQDHIFKVEKWAIEALNKRLDQVGLHPDLNAVMHALNAEVYRAFRNEMAQPQAGTTRGLLTEADQALMTTRMLQSLWEDGHA